MTVNGNERVVLIGKLMDALAAELAQLKNKPARRKELAQQISDLSKLIQALKTGEDFSLKPR